MYASQTASAPVPWRMNSLQGENCNPTPLTVRACVQIYSFAEHEWGPHVDKAAKYISSDTSRLGPRLPQSPQPYDFKHCNILPFDNICWAKKDAQWIHVGGNVTSSVRFLLPFCQPVSIHSTWSQWVPYTLNLLVSLFFRIDVNVEAQMQSSTSQNKRTSACTQQKSPSGINFR